MAKLRRDAGASLDDDAALLLMARSMLDGPRDEGRASYQVALAICSDCRQARQQGGGEAVEVGPEIAAMAESTVSTLPTWARTALSSLSAPRKTYHRQPADGCSVAMAVAASFPAVAMRRSLTCITCI